MCTRVRYFVLLELSNAKTATDLLRVLVGGAGSGVIGETSNLTPGRAPPADSPRRYAGELDPNTSDGDRVVPGTLPIGGSGAHLPP